MDETCEVCGKVIGEEDSADWLYFNMHGICKCCYDDNGVPDTDDTLS